MLAVCQSFSTNFCAGIHSAAVSFCFLAWLPFRQRMRPGVYIGGQCLRGLPSDSRASNEKRPLEFTLSRTRNTWRGVRAPRAARNVPRPLPPVPWSEGRGPPPQRREWRHNFLKCVFSSVRARPAAPPRVGPARRARHRRRGPRFLADFSRFGARAERAATCAMFLTNNTAEKRYRCSTWNNFFGKKP